DALTILASGIIFGSAGLWLVPNQAKGAIVGAAAGAAAAAGHVQKSKQLRRLASTVRLSTEETAIAAQAHTTRIKKVEDDLQIESGRIDTTLNEIKKIKERPEKPKLKACKNSTATDIERIEGTLKELEHSFRIILERPSEHSRPTEPIAKESIAKELIVKEPVGDDPEDMQEGEAAQSVIEWFRSNQIEVDNYYEPDPKIDALLDGLSLYLGDNYSTLKKLHWKLRSSVGRRAHFDLGSYDSRAKRIHNQYLKKLKSSDYLSLGRLVKKPEGSDFIVADSYNRPDVQGFFDGGWFERFIYYKVVELFDSEGVSYQYLRNPKIVYENGDSSELDLFFLVNGKPLLIECKAGQNYHQGIEKFGKHRQRLNFDSSNAMFVVLDIDETEAHIRTNNWNITVADQNDFLVRIRESIADHENPQSLNDDEDNEENNEEDNNSSVLAEDDNDNLESFFKKLNLNLAPESRPVVFEALVKTTSPLEQPQSFNKLEQPQSFNELVKTLRDNVPEESSVSRRKISEILNCLRHFDLFRNETKKPIQNTAKLIYGIASKNQRTFEKKCMEFYVEKILNLFDPDFFDEEDNVALFESLTLGKAPSPEKIQQIKERQGNIRADVSSQS
ncbi:MAG: hypothetical protein WBC73_23025, partial [Phormidesmis sp.]